MATAVTIASTRRASSSHSSRCPVNRARLSDLLTPFNGTHERKNLSYQLTDRVAVLPVTRTAWYGLAPRLRKIPPQAALVIGRTTPGQAPREIGSDQLAHGRLGLVVRLLGTVHPFRRAAI